MLPLVFCGRSDDTGFGDGDKLLLNLTSNDSSAQIDITFSESVIIKKGFIQYKDAPFGSCFHCDVIIGTTTVHHFVKDVMILGNGQFSFDTGEESFLENGAFLRIIVFNSSGQNGEDAPASFQLVGNLLVRRATTT